MSCGKQLSDSRDSPHWEAASAPAWVVGGADPWCPALRPPQDGDKAHPQPPALLKHS